MFCRSLCISPRRVFCYRPGVTLVNAKVSRSSRAASVFCPSVATKFAPSTSTSRGMDLPGHHDGPGLPAANVEPDTSKTWSSEVVDTETKITTSDADAMTRVLEKDVHTESDSSRSQKRIKLDEIASEVPQLNEESSQTLPTEAKAESEVDSADAPRKKLKEMSRREYAGHAKSKKKEKTEKKSRNRRGTRNEEDAMKAEGSTAATPGEEAQKAPRLPKRQCALLIGYCGAGYSGMQIQPNVRTIEGVLFDALVKAGCVSQDNADNPVKVNLNRAARTDAGVHAAGNVVSIKMITILPGVQDVMARINENLPSEIRVWGYVRVQNSFNARLSCDSRKYTYFFPSYLLIPPKPGSNLIKAISAVVGATAVDPLSHPFWSDADGGNYSNNEEELQRKRQWRISAEELASLRSVTEKYLGTHNFHNFTIGREFSDRSNQRHMIKLEVSDPHTYGETEWISVMFHGQSFMLHQRKMMSALVLSCRFNAPPGIIDELYGPRTVFVPKMPALGLLLEGPVFDSYNNKVTAVNETIERDDPAYRPCIDFGIHREAIEKFKDEYIYNNMRSVEDRDGIFDAWIRSIDAYGGNDLLYLNAMGNIPAEAVIKKGQRRANPFQERRHFDATAFSADNQKDPSDKDEEEVPLDLQKKHLIDTEG